MLPLVGDGLLPADVDGKTKPKNDAPIPIIGTQDDGAGYGATFDALNITDEVLKYYANNTTQPRAFYDNGRQFFFGVRAKY